MRRFLVPAILLCLAVSAGACSGGSDGDVTDAPTTTATAVSSRSPAVSSPASAALPAGTVTFYGADAGDQAGSIISGDFNGDGVVDVAVGAGSADGPDNSRTGAGEVYIFHGPFQPGISLDAGKKQYDAIFFGAAPGDDLGRTLAVGDFNGDKIDDLAMAAPSADRQRGSVYLMFGSDQQEAVTDFAVTQPDVLLTGNNESDFAGIAMSTGDIDADGISDLLVGALLADGAHGDRADSGEAYVLRGQQLLAGDTIALRSSAGVIYGARAGDHLGESLGFGDFNGDGKDDIVVVGTFNAGPVGDRPDAGQTYVIDSPATFPIDLAAAAPQFTIVGADSGDQLGHSMGIADTNGDGYDDLWLGAVSADGPGNTTDLEGEAALFLGGPGVSGVLDAAASAATATIYGPEKEARLGRSAAAGNVIGDSKADLLVSAPNVRQRAGQVYIFTGGAAPYPQDASGAAVTLSGLDAGDILGHESFGLPALGVADVDGDGRGDVLVVAPGGDGPKNDRTDAGEAYLVPGSALR